MPKLKSNSSKSSLSDIKHSPNNLYYLTSTNSAFTIVELLVVIVVIGILAAVTIISYSGISSKATAASLQSDLTSAKTKLQMYQVEYGSYPENIVETPSGSRTYCPDPDLSVGKYCFNVSPSNIFTYTSITPFQTFVLDIEHAVSDVRYRVTETTAPVLITDDTPLTCPTGFIVVPGSVTYGTSDFCVMKYEAKNVAGVATSQPELTPWVSVSQTTAITTAASACSGCHLITEAERMTIAQNVLSVPSNWSGGSVGNGYIYSGHNDGNPASAIAVTNTVDAYNSTGNVAPSSQKRTLTLTNGEVIWDMAGNVYEWTSGQTTGGQPGITGEATYTWKQWSATPMTTGTLTVNPFPTGTGISGAGTWNSTNGIGQLRSNVGDVSLRGFVRGGYWFDGVYAGILSMSLECDPGYSFVGIGFRVTK